MTMINIGSQTAEPTQKGVWRIDPPDGMLLSLVRCLDQETVHISRSCVCNRYAIRGVPARSVDVLVDRRILDHSAEDLSVVLERSIKAGKYDHAVRDRWLIRLMVGHQAAQLTGAELLLRGDQQTFSLRVLCGDAVASRADYDRLPPIDASYDQIACVKRNWTRYFRFLDWDADITPLLDTYSPLIVSPDDTISELNMHASQFLVDVSHRLGWRRVVAPAAGRKGLALWVRDDNNNVQASDQPDADDPTEQFFNNRRS